MSYLDLREFREKMGLSQEKLAQELGVTARTVQYWEAKSSIPPTQHEKIRQLMEHCEENSSDVKDVLPTQGGMLNLRNSLQYYSELDVTASNVEGLIDNEVNAVYKLLNIPGLEGCVGFNVRGDSMIPTMKHGDVVAVEREPVKTIVNGEIYFVLTRDNQRMIKRLVYNKEKEIVTCFSDNPDQRLFAPFDIEQDIIIRVLRVRGCLSYELLG